MEEFYLQHQVANPLTKATAAGPETNDIIQFSTFEFITDSCYQ